MKSVQPIDRMNQIINGSSLDHAMIAKSLSSYLPYKGVEIMKITRALIVMVLTLFLF